MLLTLYPDYDTMLETVKKTQALKKLEGFAPRDAGVELSEYTNKKFRKRMGME